jgi:hypothetical protein
MKIFNLSTVIVVVMVVASIIVILNWPRHGVVVYNCTIAEISPDIPLKVKEACRKANAEAYRK